MLRYFGLTSLLVLTLLAENSVQAAHPPASIANEIRVIKLVGRDRTVYVRRPFTWALLALGAGISTGRCCWPIQTLF